MAKQNPNEPQPVEFICHNCGKKSRYPDSAFPESKSDTATTVVKKCLTCGADNKITLPAGWVFKADATVLRGEK